jgi:hypothetical protein
MPRLLRRVAPWVGILAAFAAGSRAGAPQDESPPFAPGEKLSYAVTWSVFPAGAVTAILQRTGNSPQDDYVVVTTARSQGFVSLLYSLDDEYHSRFNPGTICSGEIWKRVNEGRRHKQTQIVFDSTRRVAVLDERNLSQPNESAKHQENPIPACVEDVVTAFYFIRKQPLRVGEAITVPVNDGSKTTSVNVEVQAREQINTPLGRRWAFRVEPTVFGNLYKRKGRMLIWFSDDPQRLPLLIKAMISVGTLTGTLQSVTQSPPVAAPGLQPGSKPGDGGSSLPNAWEGRPERNPSPAAEGASHQ